MRPPDRPHPLGPSTASPTPAPRVPARARRPVPAVVRVPAALARACHPLPTVAVTVLVTALAVTAGRSGPDCAVVAAAVLTGQLSVGWSNDAVDARRDLRAGRADKPVASGAVSARTAWVAAWSALALCVPLSLVCGALAGAAHLVFVAAGWAYNLGVKATVWSWLPYAAGFGALPAFIALGSPGHPPPAWWAVGAAALLGVGAHLADALPDIDEDLRAGVRGGPQRIGPTGVRLLLPLPPAAATALLVPVPPGPEGVLGRVAVALVVGAVLGGAVAAGRRTDRPRPRGPFVAVVAVAAADVALLVARGASIA
ncbi:UbiA family prenyltransferase [Streptomyces macrosporus]|uniref:UbiA family prenyltransferase n=1 Tax=Streptomyces macrosporus TaxID=44032 RepID=A0ABN3JNE1_9ACTN